MANTTNFGWETPDDTDLVKDGAAAMRTLGNSIDASFVDLKGGTTGQILSKNSNTDLDYVWINNDQGDITAVTAGTGISGGGTSGAVTITNSMATEITASGDIIVGTGSGTFDNLPIGTTGQVLTADTTVSPYKVKWATPSSTGGLTLIQNQTFTTVSSYSLPANTFSATYTNYEIILDVTAFSANNTLTARLRSGSTDYTDSQYIYQELAASGGSATANTATSQSSIQIGDVNSATNYQMKMTLFKPNVTIKKWYFADSIQYTQSGVWKYIKASGRVDTASAYDSMSFIPSSGTMTGRVYVYGYNI